MAAKQSDVHLVRLRRGRCAHSAQVAGAAPPRSDQAGSGCPRRKPSRCRQTPVAPRSSGNGRCPALHHRAPGMAAAISRAKAGAQDAVPAGGHYQGRRRDAAEPFQRVGRKSRIRLPVDAATPWTGRRPPPGGRGPPNRWPPERSGQGERGERPHISDGVDHLRPHPLEQFEDTAGIEVVSGEGAGQHQPVHPAPAPSCASS